VPHLAHTQIDDNDSLPFSGTFYLIPDGGSYYMCVYHPSICLERRGINFSSFNHIFRLISE
jgi:hypothetical protein